MRIAAGEKRSTFFVRADDDCVSLIHTSLIKRLLPLCLLYFIAETRTSGQQQIESRDQSENVSRKACPAHTHSASIQAHPSG